MLRKTALKTRASPNIWAHIAFLEAQLQAIRGQIQDIVTLHPHLVEQQQILRTIPGVGEIVATEFLILLAELGQVNRRQIASLAGIAPRVNDSGTFSGYRRVGYERGGVKPILFLAAMAARRSSSP